MSIKEHNSAHLKKAYKYQYSSIFTARSHCLFDYLMLPFVLYADQVHHLRFFHVLIQWNGLKKSCYHWQSEHVHFQLQQAGVSLTFNI